MNTSIHDNQSCPIYINQRQQYRVHVLKLRLKHELKFSILPSFCCKGWMLLATAWFFAIANCSLACSTRDSSTLWRPTVLVQILVSAYFLGENVLNSQPRN
jgi:hypothetical protein